MQRLKPRQRRPRGRDHRDRHRDRRRVVIVSVGTGGIADEVDADAAVVGLAADGVGAYDACASAPDPLSRQCAAGLGQVALDYATFGLGGELTGTAADAFDITSSLRGYGYSQWAGSRPIASTRSASTIYCRGGSVPVYGPSGGLNSYGSYSTRSRRRACVSALAE